MDGFLWLILQALPLITAAAVIFFILGSRWRGQDIRQEQSLQEPLKDAESTEAQTAREERDAARAMEEKLRLKLIETQRELQESNDRQTQLQKEILRLSDELKAALISPPLPDTSANSSPAPVEVAKDMPATKKTRRKATKSANNPKEKKVASVKSVKPPTQD